MPRRTQRPEHPPAVAGFRLHKPLGSGGFGTVYLATPAGSPAAEYAVKLEDPPHHYLHLEQEVYAALWALRRAHPSANTVPRMHRFGTHATFTYLVLDRLGPSLDTRLGQSGGGLSLKTCLIVAVQAIRRLEAIHRAGFVHRDVKPANMLTGYAGNDLRTLYIVDFGAAKRYVNEAGHIPRRGRGRFIGTARYASIRAQGMSDTSRRDDLESLGYSLLQLLNGRLPWQGLKINDDKKRHRAMLERKKTIPLRELCKGFSGMTAYMTYVRALRFEQDPDYSKCRAFFRSAMKKNGIVDDGMYDWLERV